MVQTSNAVNAREKAKYMNVVVRKNVQRILRDRTIQQQELAEDLDTTPASVSQLLRGKKRLLFEDFIVLSEILDVSVETLMDDTLVREELKHDKDAAASMLHEAEAILRLGNEMKKAPVDNRPEPSELCPRRDSNPGHAD